MTFREFILEYKLMGKVKAYEKILYNTFLDFLNDHFKVSLDVEVSFRKPSNKLYFGYIDLRSATNGKYKIIVENGATSSVLSKIGHEFTHLVQAYKNELSYSDDEKYIKYKGKEYISIKDLKKITNIIDYKKLPWETEAYKVQDLIVSKFKKSKFYKELYGKDKTLDFIIDSDGL